MAKRAMRTIPIIAVLMILNVFPAIHGLLLRFGWPNGLLLLPMNRMISFLRSKF